MEKASKEYFETFGIDKFLDKVKNSKVFKGLLVGSALTGVSAACVNKAPVVEAAPLPSADEKSTPSIEEAPTETLLPIATLAPTETEDPFEGLSICRTWQEAEYCPITVADFERLPDFVKANFTFPSEAMKVSWLEAISYPGHTSYVKIHALSSEEMAKGTGAAVVATESTTSTEKEYVYTSSFSPIGKAFFFTLKADPPAINYDNVVAVFPVNNADGSVGTYTVIQPPNLFQGNFKTAEEYTEALYKFKFDEMPYLPPVYNIGEISEQNIYFLDPNSQGTFITEIVNDTKNQENGKRKELFNEWKETGVIPKELEKIPLLSSDFDLHM
ncbi:hypothetical protein KKF04_00210, partial [Patescibacteria group bacterium]|nr:hypothetical protein [Patescibacteria group bacterium]